MLTAKRDINILAAPESARQQSTQRSTRSGLFSSGGMGIALGSQRQSAGQTVQSTTSAPSTVGSLQGPVTLIAGNTYRQSGSNLWAPKNDAIVLARKIEINGSPETEQGSSYSRFKQIGLALSISSPVIGIAQTASSLADAAGNTSTTRMQALAAGAVALNVHAQRKALQALASGKVQDMGLGLSLSLGSSSSQSDSVYAISSMRQSQVLAGGNVGLFATGAGEQSDLVLQDASVYAGKVATLQADHKIFMLTTPEARSENSRNRSRSAGISLSLSAAGPAIGASASHGTGRTQSEDRINRKTLVTGGEGLILDSGSDTEMRDAIISAPWVGGKVGGNLILESLQDTSRFDGRQSLTGGSIAAGPGLVAGGASYSDSRATGDFASVIQRSGIYAGDGGFDLDVKGSTVLQGGVIASTQAAVDNERNRLATATLIHSDIENRSDFEASGINLSAGLTANRQKPVTATGSDTVTDPAGWSLQNQGKPGTGVAAAGVSHDSGSERSITRSSISPGTLSITDKAAQLAATGQTAAEAIASIDRNVRTGDDSPSLTRKWDGPQMLWEQEANSQIAAAFGQQASRAAGVLAEDLAVEARTSADETTATKWDEGGEYRVSLHAGISALTGGFEGAAGAAFSAAMIPKIGERIASMNLHPVVTEALNTVAATALGAVANAPGTAAALNQAANNYVSRSPFPGVRRMTSRENARLLKQCGENCTQQDFIRIDRQVAQVETAANLVAISQRSTLTLEQAKQLTQSVIDLAPGYSNLESLAQTITGHSTLSGEEVNRLWAAIGVLPAGGMIKKIREPATEAISKLSKELSLRQKTATHLNTPFEIINSTDVNDIANRIIAADRAGSALKTDPTHIAASYLSKEELTKGKAFIITGLDGIKRTLLQTKGGFNEKIGIYEYIIDSQGKVTHQRFIENGVINGIPNQQPGK